MVTVKIPNNWTPLEANAAITLIEAMLDALWRRYPEPLEEYFYEQLDDDGYPLQEPPENLVNEETPDAQEPADPLCSDEIPF